MNDRVEPKVATTIAGEWNVRRARDRYLETNGFSTGTYGADKFEVDFLGRTWTFPNTAPRKHAIPWHDLHHVATGYGTDLAGEAEIGIWEIMSGCDTLFLIWINGTAALLGLFVAPLRLWRAFRRALRLRPLTLYVLRRPYDEVLEWSVATLRERLGLPEDGLADRPAALHRRAPGARATLSAAEARARADQASTAP
jgi:hypothetical protein